MASRDVSNGFCLLPARRFFDFCVNVILSAGEGSSLEDGFFGRPPQADSLRMTKNEVGERLVLLLRVLLKLLLIKSLHVGLFAGNQTLVK